MEGSDSEFANFTPPTSKAFLEAYSQNVSGNKQYLVAQCVWQQAISCCSCYRMPQNAFFPWTHGLQVSQKMTERHFSPTHHPLSPVIFATATVVAFVLLHSSRFNFHCYTQREATPTQKSAQKWHCNLQRLLAWKITKGIHSCKPASLNRPIDSVATVFFFYTKPNASSLSSSHLRFSTGP